jgi:hypothetical protein
MTVQLPRPEMVCRIRNPRMRKVGSSWLERGQAEAFYLPRLWLLLSEAWMFGFDSHFGNETSASGAKVLPCGCL